LVFPIPFPISTPTAIGIIATVIIMTIIAATIATAMGIIRNVAACWGCALPGAPAAIHV
jgi:hypothetical protein